MESIQSILLGIHIICAVFIVILVLLQPSTGDGSLVTNHANPSGFVTGRTVASFLQKFTFLIAAIFMVNVLLLGIISHRSLDKGSELEQALEKQIEYEEQSVPKGE